MLSVGPRLLEAELIDAPRQDLAELAASLRQVAQVNRHLGGTSALRRHLSPHLDSSNGILTILDVGTGNGDVAAELEDWARDRGARCRVTGLDAHTDVMRVAAEAARSRGKPVLVQGDALALPFPDAVFDVSCCTLTLHHFGEHDAIRLVAEMARVTRVAIIVNDLERTSVNYWSARVLSRTWWRGNRLTRHDGPLSVLRSFTARELARIGHAAGLESGRVHRHFPFRLVLEGGPKARGDRSGSDRRIEP